MKKFHILLAGLAMMLTSCSPFTLISSTTYNNADLRDYTTFRIVTPDEGKLPPGMTMVTYYNIAAAIREQMAERGYTESPSSPLLINIGLTVKQQIATEPAIMAAPAPVPPVPPVPAPAPGAPVPPPGSHFWGPAYSGMAPWFMYPRSYYWRTVANPNAQVITGIYNEGVLTMDMVNIDTKTPLYSASVGTIVDGSESQFRNLKGIAEAVQTLFSNFPVKVITPTK